MDKDASRGWVVVFSAFMSHTLTHGIVYSYGILFVSLREAFNGTKSELGWIVSLTTGSLYLTGPLASILVGRFGNRNVAIIGAILSSVGYILTIFATSLYFMYFSLGLLSGVGFGLIFIPCVVDVTIRFEKYRALACGTAVSGAGFGAFVVSPLIKVLLDEYTWRGTLLIQAGILLNCIPCALTFTGKDPKIHGQRREKSTISHVEKGTKKEKQTFKNTNNDKRTEANDVETDELLDKSIKQMTDECVLTNEVVQNSAQTIDKDLKHVKHSYLPLRTDDVVVDSSTDNTDNCFINEENECKNIPEDSELSVNRFPVTAGDICKCITGDVQSVAGDNMSIIMEFNNEKTIFYARDDSKIKANDGRWKIREDNKCIQKSYQDKFHEKISRRCCGEVKFASLLRRKDMLLFYSSQVLFISGLYLPFVFLPELAISLGISEQSAAWIISTIGISTVFGRILLGYLSDRKFIDRVYLYRTALLMAGITTAVVPALKSFGLLVTYAVLYGLSTAVLLSQTTVVLVEIVGMESMTDAMGLNNMFCGFGALLGPPLLGLLYDKTGNFLASFLVSGLGMVLGSVLQCLMSVVSNRQTPKEH